MYRWPILFCLFFVFLAASTFCEPFDLEKIEHTISESEIIERRDPRWRDQRRERAVRFVVLIEIPGMDRDTWVDVFFEFSSDYEFSYKPLHTHFHFDDERRSFYITDKGIVLDFWAVPRPESATKARIASPVGRKLVIFMAKSK